MILHVYRLLVYATYWQLLLCFVLFNGILPSFTNFGKKEFIHSKFFNSFFICILYFYVSLLSFKKKKLYWCLVTNTCMFAENATALTKNKQMTWRPYLASARTQTTFLIDPQGNINDAVILVQELIQMSISSWFPICFVCSIREVYKKYKLIIRTTPVYHVSELLSAILDCYTRTQKNDTSTCSQQ